MPFAGERAGYLFAVTAAGMLLGDIVVGRFLAVGLRDRLIGPLRLLLAVPYLAFFLVPSLPYAAALAFVASVGLLREPAPAGASGDAHRRPGARSGLRPAGHRASWWARPSVRCSAARGERAGVGPVAAAQAMGVMAVASVVVSIALTPGLRRSRPGPRCSRAPRPRAATQAAPRR